MEKAKGNPCVASCKVKRQSLIDTLYQIVDEIISEMPLKEKVALANMKKKDVGVLQGVFDLYIRSKVNPEDEEYTNIMQRLWKRLRETYRLRVVK
jgi:hypothetical protein